MPLQPMQDDGQAHCGLAQANEVRTNERDILGVLGRHCLRRALLWIRVVIELLNLE